MYDDYVELRPGAAKDFELWLNKAYTKSGLASGDHRNHSSNHASNHGGHSAGASASQQQQRGALETDRPSQPSAPTYDPRIQQRTQRSTIINCNPENRWLLICAKVRKKPIGLEQFDVSTILSDRQLFKDLRRLYGRLRARWIKWLPLRKVTGVRFVRVFVQR